MPEDKKVFNNPKELSDYLNTKYGKTHPTIEQNKGVFSIWYMTNQMWFDETICKCRKKGMSEASINKLYEMLKNLNNVPQEKEKARKILDTDAILMYNGEVLVEIN